MELELICECNNIECAAPLPIDEAKFRAARAMDPNSAIVLPGHEDFKDTILHNNGDYLVVV